jgi:hypothetical protein
MRAFLILLACCGAALLQGCLTEPSDPFGDYVLVRCKAPTLVLGYAGCTYAAVTADSFRVLGGHFLVRPDGQFEINQVQAYLRSGAWSDTATSHVVGTYVVLSGAGAHVILDLNVPQADVPYEPATINGRELEQGNFVYYR